MDLQERKELIQKTIDCIMYSKGFKEELVKLIELYPLDKAVKSTSDRSKFMFPIEKAI